MDYEILPRKTAEKARPARMDWVALLGSLTPDNAVRIPCLNSAAIRKYQPRFYEAALRLHLKIKTFSSEENGQLFLNIILAELPRNKV